MHNFLPAFSTGGDARRARLDVPISLRGSHSHGALSRFVPWRQCSWLRPHWHLSCGGRTVATRRPCLTRAPADGTYSVSSQFVATPHRYREAVPVRGLVQYPRYGAGVVYTSCACAQALILASAWQTAKARRMGPNHTVNRTRRHILSSSVAGSAACRLP
jgi:hypothetical protein